MDPFSWVALVMMVVAAVGGAYSYQQQGKAQSKISTQQAEYTKQASEAQAKAARREAEWADYRITVNKQQSEEKKRLALQQGTESITRARLSKGISSGSGTLLAEEVLSLKNLGHTMDLIDWDTAIEETNIRKEQGGYSHQANLSTWSGDWAMLQGETLSDAYRRQGNMQAGSSLLSGGAQAGAFYVDRKTPSKKT